MLYKIADLIADIPAADGLAVRCRDYLYGEEDSADVIIRTELYRREIYPALVSDEEVAYLESGCQFYRELLKHNGFYLHSSAVVRDGKAYLFSGFPGAGKSTHTRLWVSTFGGDTRIINDDKPALRCMDGVWYAYGTPWCGKDGININEKVPVAGVCFMKKADHNSIRRLSSDEFTNSVISQTMFSFNDLGLLDAFACNINDFLSKIPVFELENRPEPEAAYLSYETMKGAAPGV